MRTQKIALTGLIALLLAAGSARADTTVSSSGATTAKKSGRDPVASAFQLPRGTNLSDKQQKAYDKLKAKYESTLREAMDSLASKDPKEKNKGLKLNRDTRASIRTGIKEILAMSSQGSQRNTSTSSGGMNGQQSDSGSQAGSYPPGGGMTGGGYPMMPGGGMMRGGGGCSGRR
jgi:hypothetical protein